MNNYWTKVARSNEVTSLMPFVTKRHKTLPPMCLWREPDNSIGAIERFCPIGKEDLANGTISNNGIICPKHRITWTSCGNANSMTSRVNTISYWWPTKEVCGSIYVKWK